MKKRHYILVDSSEKLPSFSEAKFVSLDLETTSLNPRLGNIIGVSFALDDTTGYYISDPEKMDKFLKWLGSKEDIAKIFHNAVFDLGFLTQKGYDIKGDIHDTMILAHLLDPDREEVNLKFLSKEQWGEGAVSGDVALKQWLSDNSYDKSELHRAPLDILTHYAAEDAINTYGLFTKFCGSMRNLREWMQERGYENTPWEYYRAEYMPLFRVIVAMQLKGVKLDLEQTSKKKLELAQRLEVLKNEMTVKNKKLVVKAEDFIHARLIQSRLAKNKSGKLKKDPARVVFNWDSNDHLKILFYTILKEIPSRKTLKGGTSLNVEVLEGFKEKYPWVETLLEYKEIRKLVNTYLDSLLKLQDGGNIHAQFNSIGTATGRFSSSNPNLQNLPKHGNIKGLFVPRDGKTFIYADYSQLELRIAAHLSGDKLLTAAYIDGLDLHAETAKTIGCTRDEGKRINFAIIYNAGGWRIADIMGLMAGLPLCTSETRDWRCECVGCKGRKKAMRRGDKAIESLFGKYSGLKKYLDKQMNAMLKYNLTASAFGRIRRLKKLGEDHPKAVRNHDLKAGFNLPIQSFGASLCKRAMIKLHEKGYTILNQIHDSILIEVDNKKVDKAMAEVKSIMENIYKLNVPLLVEPKILTSFEEKVEDNV